MGRKILLFLTVLIVSLVFAGEFRSIEAIKASGELRILQTEDYWYPFYYLDEEGKLGGIDVELGRDIAAALGVKPLFVRAVATHETLATHLREGEGDIILSYYSYSPSRASQVYASRDYLVQNLSLLINNQVLQKIKNEVDELTPEKLIENLNDPSISVLVMIGTVYERIALQLLPGTKIFSIGTTENLAGLLFERNYDVFFMNDLWTETFLVKNPSLLIHYSIYRLPSEDQIVVGVNPANTDLLEWINRFLDSDYNKTREYLNRYVDYELIAKLHQETAEESRIKLLLEDPYRWIVLFVILLLAFLVVWSSQKKIAKKSENGKAPHWLLNIWTILFAMVLGFYSGGAFPDIVEGLSPLGELFFNYMLLCGLPILFCVVTLNILRLLMKSGGGGFLLKFLGVVLVFFVLGALIGIVVAMIVEPGTGVAKESQEALVVSMKATNPFEEVNVTTGSILWSLPTNMISNSIIRAFAENKTLAIVFFSIVLAFAIKFINDSKREVIINSLETAGEIFIFLFKLSYYVLPFGIFSLMLSQASVFTGDTSVMKSLIMLIGCQLLCFVIWLVVSIALGAKLAKMSPLAFLGAIKKPTMLLFALMSSVAVIPEALHTSERVRQFNDENQRGVLPLLVVMLQPHTVSLFAVVAIFNLQLLGRSLGPVDYLYIAISSIIAVIATIGVPSPLDLFTISMVVLPFNIPPTQAIFFMLPWMYTGRRLDLMGMMINDFAAVQLFRSKKPKEESPSPVAEVHE